MASISLHTLIKKFIRSESSPQQLRDLARELENQEDAVMDFMEKDWAAFKVNDDARISVEKADLMLDHILKVNTPKARTVIITGWLQRSAASWLLLLLAASCWVGYRYYQSQEVVFISTKSKKIVLPDGTQVYLHGAGRLCFQESFWADQRNVKFSGEGFFDVHPNKNQPFIIATPKASVRVVGTSFNLKQYEEGMWVAVSEGRVLMSNTEGKTISLIKNQLGQLLSNGKLSKENTDVANYSSWQPGRPLRFQNMPFDEVAHQLERMYGVQMQWPKSLDSKILTASSHYDTLPNILDKIALTLNIDYQIKDKRVVFMTK